MNLTIYVSNQIFSILFYSDSILSILVCSILLIHSYLFDFVLFYWLFVLDAVTVLKEGAAAYTAIIVGVVIAIIVILVITAGLVYKFCPGVVPLVTNFLIRK